MDMIMLSQAGEFGKLEELLPLHAQLADVAVWFIIAIAVVGWIANRIGISRTRREVGFLSKNADLSYEEMNEKVNQEKKKDDFKEKGFSNYTVQRISALLEGEKTNRIPTLSELHGLTQRSEYARRSYAISRTITSILIICGIAGSVLGIHGADLANQTGGDVLTHLPNALMPSFWAVFLTVLLFFSRTRYMLKFQQFLGKLDHVTSSQFMGRLRHTTVEATVQNLKEMQESVLAQVGGYGKIFSSVQENMETWVNTNKSYLQSSEGILDSARRMEEIFGNLTRATNRNTEYFVLLEKTLTGIAETQKNAVSQMENMHKNQIGIVESLSNQRKENNDVAAVLSSLVSSVQDSAIKNAGAAQILGKTVTGIHRDLSQLEDTLRSVNNSAQTFDKSFSETSVSMTALEGTFKGAVDNIDRAGSSMVASGEKLAASVRDIEKDFVAIKESVARIRDSGTGFTGELRSIDSNVRGLVELPDRLTRESEKLRSSIEASMDDLKRKLEDACSDLKKFHHSDRMRELISEADVTPHVAPGSSIEHSERSPRTAPDATLYRKNLRVPADHAATADVGNASSAATPTPPTATHAQTYASPAEKARPSVSPSPGRVPERAPGRVAPDDDEEESADAPGGTQENKPTFWSGLFRRGK